MQKYIKKGETFKKENIEGLFYQAFLNTPVVTINNSVIMDLWQKKKVNNEDIQIIDFIFQSSICTKSQLEKFAKIKDISKIDDRLAKLSENLIINYFILTDERKFKAAFPADAERYYCMHVGGSVLLEQLGNYKAVCFEPGKVIQGAGKVIRHCAVTEISLLLLKAKGVDVEITPSPFFTVSTPGIAPRMLKSMSSYWLSFEGSSEHRTLILDTVFQDDRNFDMYDMLANYSQFLSSQLWKKYYGPLKKPPLLLIVVHSEETALKCANQFNVISKGRFNNYMFVTTESLSNIKDIPPYFSCLKYDPESQSLVPFNHYLFS